MYEVIKDFIDLHDADHAYHVGDVFPREGIRVTQPRLDELAGDKNKLGTPLIARVDEAPGAVGEAEIPSGREE